MALAYCNEFGRIRITSNADVPPRCFTLASGSATSLRRAIVARSRHSRTSKGFYFVPGLPEADTLEQAFAAVRAFRLWLTKGKPHLTAAS